MTVFTVAVPCMIVAALIIAGIRIHRTGLTAAAFAGGSTNPMLGSWVTSAVNYAAYNFFATVGILAPMTQHLKSRSTAGWGTLLGCVLLLAVALGVLCALATSPESIAAPLPMLDLACRLGAAGIVYAVLLFFGMFGTSVSSLVAVLTYTGQKSAWLSATARSCARAHGRRLCRKSVWLWRSDRHCVPGLRLPRHGRHAACDRARHTCPPRRSRRLTRGARPVTIETFTSPTFWNLLQEELR